MPLGDLAPEVRGMGAVSGAALQDGTAEQSLSLGHGHQPPDA
jgi:hypothetical protein